MIERHEARCADNDEGQQDENELFSIHVAVRRVKCVKKRHFPGCFRLGFPAALISVLGHEVDVKSATSDVKGMNVQVVPKEAKKTYDLVLKFDELPQVFTNTKVTIETSLASLPKIEVPLTISVPGGN